MALTLMYITNSPEVAEVAEKCGVDRIWIDLETLGKEERQKGMNTVKSQHCVGDIRKIKPLLKKAELLVRVNPWNGESVEEINRVIAAGADIIMLPMWKSAEEVKNFLDAVGGRCKTTLLLETREAVECIDEVLEQGGMNEIHIGLNDLHLSYGLTFMFELLSNGVVERLCRKMEKKGVPYGFGGIARLGSGDLPAERIIMEHYRLHSTRAILSRSFCNTEYVRDIKEINELFDKNMCQLREYEKLVEKCSKEELLKNKYEIQTAVEKIVKAKKEKKNGYR